MTDIKTKECLKFNIQKTFQNFKNYGNSGWYDIFDSYDDIFNSDNDILNSYNVMSNYGSDSIKKINK